MGEPIRALVVDDHPLFRQGVVQSLDAVEDIVVIGEAACGAEALTLCMDLLPDIVLLDISMPGWNGLTTTEKILAACPATKVIIVTVSEDRDTLLKAFKAGAHAYVLKGAPAHDLVEAVRLTIKGEVYVSQSLAADMLLSLTHRAAQDPLQELTEREKEILALIATGLTNREIGEELFLSEKTIKHYVTNILQKLQVRSRLEAALLALNPREYFKNKTHR
jgi:DNA-binding NarL/FixJ family response regulator